jgi:hypothetical protein
MYTTFCWCILVCIKHKYHLFRYVNQDLKYPSSVEGRVHGPEPSLVDMPFMMRFFIKH